MKWLAIAFDFLFGCRHRNLSRVFTIGGQSYRVCCDCGAKFGYSLATMSIEQGAPAPRVASLRHAHTLRGSE